MASGNARRLQFLAYLGLLLCALLLVAGSLAAIFETATIVRIYGGLVAVMALVAGGIIARHAWPRPPAWDSAAVAETRREPVYREVDHPQ